MPGDPVSNMGPPTAVLLALAAGQLSLVLALRPTVLRWTERATVRRAVGRLSERVMTAYLWHTPALVLVAGVALLGFGVDTPHPFSGAWYAGVPLWLTALTAVLAVLVRLFGPLEGWPLPELAPGPVRVTVATVLLGGGLLGLTLTGFAPAPGVTGPWAASFAIAGGLLVLARRRPTIDRWTRRRSHLTPDVPSGDRDGQAVARTGA